MRRVEGFYISPICGAEGNIPDPEGIAQRARRCPHLRHMHHARTLLASFINTHRITGKKKKRRLKAFDKIHTKVLLAQRFAREPKTAKRRA